MNAELTANFNSNLQQVAHLLVFRANNSEHMHSVLLVSYPVTTVTHRLSVYPTRAVTPRANVPSQILEPMDSGRKCTTDDHNGLAVGHQKSTPERTERVGRIISKRSRFVSC
ncbi:hypothetical protein CRE_03196 [Caenorhabditis remanei]|uniref:Uncharacterized protein n=1 Tax=Caenorhabditis remanei TaxID=31234 RepID=E3MMN4_CAERE|nr:hypothetical protein CRE_03196 [Caenorhabditis remanei]